MATFCSHLNRYAFREPIKTHNQLKSAFYDTL